MIIVPHTLELIDLVWYFLKLYIHWVMKPCNKGKLMEAIRKEHLSVRECNPYIDHSQKLLPIVIHNNGRPLDCECRQ